MRFYADLHVHSKYARACSTNADLEHMAFWGAVKGLDVIATGDFTHPAWMAELKEKLVADPARPGLYRLREDIEKRVLEGLPPSCRKSVRFLLSVEISTIYKKSDKTRKIHHLIYMPDFDAADRLIAKLSRIGNLTADGRPILGLDSRHLLEIALQSSEDAFLIPAHIWTPWFAVLGSRSGFDTVDECYADLAHHIFAVETGLSSDPEMNWRVSSLDRFRLTSSSDAHSPQKLGREATLFDTHMDYFSLRNALRDGDGYVGTVEFFPEEGKYHLDGHRKCGVRLTPEETKAHNGHCPVCGDPVVVGVLNRVEALADRVEGCCDIPHTAGEPCSFVPLPEILGEIHGVGTGSKAVAQAYNSITGKLGSELMILGDVPIEDITRASSSLVAEAISRLRRGEVIRDAGFDGEYGVIRLFDRDELAALQKGGLLFSNLPFMEAEKPPVEPAPAFIPEEKDTIIIPTGEGILGGLDTDQRHAAEITEGPLLVVAGPGSGKTRMLTHRIAHMVKECGVTPETCLAITFTKRACAEMRERLHRLMPEVADKCAVHTFHSLGLAMLREFPNHAGLQRGFAVAGRADALQLLVDTLHVTRKKAGQIAGEISLAKRTLTIPTELEQAFTAYAEAMTLKGWVDFDDLVALPVKMLEEDAGLAALYRERFRYISIDEYQDLDALQYRFIRLLAPENANICAIGDPHQAIYGFRGADPAYFQQFSEDYPTARTVTLAKNYRSRPVIVEAANQLVNGAAVPVRRKTAPRITLHQAATAQDEANYIAEHIEAMMGGHRSLAIHSGKTKGQEAKHSFSDFVILYRAESLSHAVADALTARGIPFRRYNEAPLLADNMAERMVTAMQTMDAKRSLLKRIEQAAKEMEEKEHPQDATQQAKMKLMALADMCAHDATRFFEEAAMVMEADMRDARADAVSLMTLHASKGLEFPVVFILGVEDGLLPLSFGEADAQQQEEERRLFYVGLTRAQDNLTFTCAHTRTWNGARQNYAPSPFLRDIRSMLVDIGEGTAPKNFTHRPKQMTLF